MEYTEQEIELSIITAVYNYEKYIGDCIDSVRKQSYSAYEHIIIDDASQDNSAEIVEGRAKTDPRIKLIRLKKNHGVGLAKNQGLKIAKGKYIAFLDSDDRWHPQKLEKQLSFMKKNACAISFTSYQLMNEDGSLRNHFIRSVPLLDYTKYIKNTIIGFSSSMINTEICGPIEFCSLRSRADTVFWLQLLKKGHNAYGIDDVLMYYRLHNNSLSAGKLKAARQVWKVYRNIEGHSLTKSFWYFTSYAFHALKKRLISKSEKAAKSF